MLSARIARFTPAVGTCRRLLSTVEALDLPTRHSLKQPPRICRDPVELKEETEKLLQTPVGELYASQATAHAGLEDAYNLAHPHIARAEYLQLGHASQIGGTLYAGESTNPSSSPTTPHDVIQLSMKPLIARMQQEGEIYMKLRDEKRIPHQAQNGSTFRAGSAGIEDSSSDEEGYQPSSDDESSSSSSSSSDDDDSDTDEELGSGSAVTGKKRSLEFAPPGPTAKMQEALLDAMACARTGAAPGDYYDLALQIMNADKLDCGTNIYTQPTHVTYNAALRGIAACDMTKEMVRDEALSSAFSLYNHLTHSRHLPRNSMTYVYMFQIIDKAFPASRVKGNISCTLWDHATRLGVVNEQVITSLKNVHITSNGPEFQILLDHIAGPLPQKYRRFVNKYRHSDNY